MSVFNVGIVTLPPIRLFAFGRVEDSGNMWLNGKATVVVIIFECSENLDDLCLTFARKGVLGGLGLAHAGVSTILDMNVNDVFFDFVVKFKGILPRKGLRLGAVELKNRIGGVEDQF